MALSLTLVKMSSSRKKQSCFSINFIALFHRNTILMKFISVIHYLQLKNFKYRPF